MDRIRGTVKRSDWLARVPLVASVLLTVLLAHQAAVLAWRLIAPADLELHGGTGQGTVERPRVDPERIVDRHLFGRSDALAAVAGANAPETNLNLTLKGIAAADDREVSRALIAGPDNKEKNYAVGADVPGGATVHEILPDRVVLNRLGTLETLRLPRFRSSATTGTPVTYRPSDISTGQGTEERLAEFVRPQAVMVDGRLRGFRVYPGRNRRAFAESGLRAGDLVTAINGMPLNDAERGAVALQQLTTGVEAVLSVERGGQVETITVRLPQ